MQSDNPWQTIFHNQFDTYTFYKGTNGATFTSKDNGTWAEAVSSGGNKTSSFFYNNPRFVYNDIKDKLCRFKTVIECSDVELFNTTGFGHLSVGLFTQQNQASGNIGDYRKAKVDITTSKVSEFLGTHTYEFIPSEIFAGLTQADYFGWQIGFRSSTKGLTLRILQLDFDVHK